MVFLFILQKGFRRERIKPLKSTGVTLSHSGMQFSLKRINMENADSNFIIPSHNYFFHRVYLIIFSMLQNLETLLKVQLNTDSKCF